MRNLCIYLIYCILCSSIVNAQSNRQLKFNAKGEFKIIQFTDTHIDLIEGDNLMAYDIIKEVIEVEKQLGQLCKVRGSNERAGFSARLENTLFLFSGCGCQFALVS